MVWGLHCAGIVRSFLLLRLITKFDNSAVQTNPRLGYAGDNKEAEARDGKSMQSTVLPQAISLHHLLPIQKQSKTWPAI